MALPAYFFIRGFEIGARQAGRLQYLSDATISEWTDLGNWIATETTILINQATNPIPVDYDIFSAGGTYYFRLIDTEGHPISNVVEFTFPLDGGAFSNGFSSGFTIQIG